MNVEQFVAKWSKIQQKESATAQTHFNDLCRLVGHPTPLEMDADGRDFSFETTAVKSGGRKGFADVFYRGKFIMEYKGPHKDLDRAYRQLLLYREDLHNPPLLITSDIHTIIIHTNFTNRPTEIYEIDFDRLLTGDGLDLLRRMFENPSSFKPTRTQQAITKASADTFVAVADAMKKHQAITRETYTAEQLAHFMVRLLFCLFAEDMGLLPEKLFTQSLRRQVEHQNDFRPILSNLFTKMRTGGVFGFYPIRYFDGTLFDDEFVPTIPTDLALALLKATGQDWSEIDPTIFGTLFERVIDESKRSQLGAHYTGQDDIALIVEPVLMRPLRDEWRELRLEVRDMEADAAHEKLVAFTEKIAGTRVLDPACGSGNFLYVALQKLLDLQKEVIVLAERNGLPSIALTAGPEQLYGIEINVYAHELAQITAWIGYLQWRYANGFSDMDDPVLRPLHNIRRMDAILTYDEDGTPIEPEWPDAEIIIGNPPFLGGQRLLRELGEPYMSDVRRVYEDRVPAGADLVTYWFEKARTQIVDQQTAERAGLIATQAIRAGYNRQVLSRIKADGDIFMAWSDKEWALEGADVRVSLIGFDDGYEDRKYLDGRQVDSINVDLSADVDTTRANPLAENDGLIARGIETGGPFEIDAATAKKLIAADEKNARVIVPIVNANDVTGRSRDLYVIDFLQTPDVPPESYPLVYETLHDLWQTLQEEKNGRASKFRENWWYFRRSGEKVRSLINGRERYIVTPRVAKHRTFVWLPAAVMPDSRLYVIGREDDYFWGVLHSRVHEVWSLATSSRHGVGNDPTYNATSCFETFPFPWPPGEEPDPAENEQVAAIVRRARQLNEWREAWLNPPPPGNGVIDTSYEKTLKKRTLTNLYNGLEYYRHTRTNGDLFMPAEFRKVTRGGVSRAQVEELRDLHTLLDRAVWDAYGWPHGLSEEEMLERLLALNLARNSG